MAFKVVVIDDNDSARKFAVLAVKRAKPDADVRTAEDGIAAREVVASFKPDAMVLDHMMPRLDGWKFLEEVRSSDWGRRTPVLFYSALDLRRDISKVPRTVFLRKPSTLDEFVAAFQKIAAM